MAYYGKRSKNTKRPSYRKSPARGRSGRKSYTSKGRRNTGGGSKQHTIRIVVEQSGVNTSRTPDTAFLTEAPVKKKSKF